MRPAPRVGRALWADTLEPEGSDGATYVESIRSNTRAIADGLSGGKVYCELGPAPGWGYTPAASKRSLTLFHSTTFQNASM